MLLLVRLVEILMAATSGVFFGGYVIYRVIVLSRHRSLLVSLV